MNQLDQDIYAESRRAHEHIFKKMLELRAQHTTKPDLKSLVDSVYALKEAHATLSDIAKEVKRLYELLERLTCMGWTVQGDYEPIRTEACTGSPDVKQTVITPKHGTPEYEQMREHFGVPEGVPFRPHWPTMLERISGDIAAGRNIPPGCDPSKMLPQYRVTIRNKKGIINGQVSDPELLKKQYKIMDAATRIDHDSPAALHSLGMLLRGLIADQREKDADEKSAEQPRHDESDEENLF